MNHPIGWDAAQETELAQALHSTYWKWAGNMGLGDHLPETWNAVAEGAREALVPELLEALQALFVDYAESEGCYCGQIIGGTSQGEPLGKCGYCIAEKVIVKNGGTFIPKMEGR